MNKRRSSINANQKKRPEQSKGIFNGSFWKVLAAIITGVIAVLGAMAEFSNWTSQITENRTKVEMLQNQLTLERERNDRNEKQGDANKKEISDLQEKTDKISNRIDNPESVKRNSDDQNDASILAFQELIKLIQRLVDNQQQFVLRHSEIQQEQFKAFNQRLTSLEQVRTPVDVPKEEMKVFNDEKFRQNEILAWGYMGPLAVPRLIEALNDKNSQVRQKAVDALVKIGAPALQAFIQVLGDEDEGVREAAAWALGEFRDPEAVPALEKTLIDKSRLVRQSAAEALRKIGTPESLKALDTYKQENPK